MPWSKTPTSDIPSSSIKIKKKSKESQMRNQEGKKTQIVKKAKVAKAGELLALANYK